MTLISGPVWTSDQGQEQVTFLVISLEGNWQVRGIPFSMGRS